MTRCGAGGVKPPDIKAHWCQNAIEKERSWWRRTAGTIQLMWAYPNVVLRQNRSSRTTAVNGRSVGIAGQPWSRTRTARWRDQGDRVRFFAVKWRRHGRMIAEDLQAGQVELKLVIRSVEPLPGSGSMWTWKWLGNRSDLSLGEVVPEGRMEFCTQIALHRYHHVLHNTDLVSVWALPVFPSMCVDVWPWQNPRGWQDMSASCSLFRKKTLRWFLCVRGQDDISMSSRYADVRMHGSRNRDQAVIFRVRVCAVWIGESILSSLCIQVCTETNPTLGCKDIKWSGTCPVPSVFLFAQLFDRARQNTWWVILAR